jgi:putative FmdB family regulatory protein
MPAYDFYCENCRNEFEVWGTVEEYSKGLLENCPMCGSDRIEQRLNAPSIMKGLRGGGSRGPSCCGPGSGSGCCG